jgi:hypothetical protein
MNHHDATTPYSKVIETLKSDGLEFGRQFRRGKIVTIPVIKKKIIGGYIPKDLPLEEFAVAICSYVQACHMNNGVKRKNFRRITIRMEFNEPN